MNFSKKLMLFEEFKEAQELEKTQATDSPDIKREIVDDVDSIIGSLEALSNQVREELDSAEYESLSEADSVMDKALDFMVRGPKIKKLQSKVNKMALKVADLEDAKDQMEGDKKAKLKEKIDKLKTQRDELQKEVDQRASKQGTIVQKMQNTAKIKGKMEVLKVSMGDKKKGDVKERIKKLKDRLKAEQEAIKDAEPSEEDKKKAEEAAKEKKG
jgi:DNA repair exonuclease SbcCD ATPase subunit